MDGYKNLREYFEEQIEPYIPALQREYETYFLRQKNQILRYLNWGLLVLMTIGVGLRFYAPHTLPSGLAAFSFGILFIYFIFKWFIVDTIIQGSKKADVFRLKFKQKMVQPILQVFDDSLQLFPKNRIDTDTLYKSGLFYQTRDTKIQGEDLVKGQYRGMELRFSEMSIKKRAKHGKNNDYNTVFEGLFMEATLPKSLGGTVFVLPNSIFKGALGLLKMKILPSSDMTYEERKAHNMEVAMNAMNHYHWDIETVKAEVGVALQEMDVNDKLVNEKFRIFADKPSVVDELLTQSGIKQFLFAYQKDELAMKVITDTKSFRAIENNAIAKLSRTNFCIAVMKDKAYLAVPFSGKNLFDPDWTENTLSFENVETMYEELNTVFNFLDGFAAR